MHRAFAGIILAEVLVVIVLLYGVWSILVPNAITAAAASAKGPEISSVSALHAPSAMEITAKLRHGGVSTIEGKVSLKVYKGAIVVWDLGTRDLTIALGDSTIKWGVPLDTLNAGSYRAIIHLQYDNGSDAKYVEFVI